MPLTAQLSNQGRLYYFAQTPIDGLGKVSVGAGWHTQPNDAWNRIEIRSTYFHSVNSWFRVALGQRSNIAIEEGSLLNYELRPFQSILLNNHIGPTAALTHRLMFEQRIFFIPDLENTMNTRLRYRLELKKHMHTDNKLYLRPMSELYYGSNDATKELMQWKTTLATGHSLNHNITIEYRYEYVMLRHLNALNHFHGFRVQLVQYF